MSNFHYLVLRDTEKESLLYHLPKMLSGDPSGVLQLQIARCAFHSSPCPITSPKTGCSSMPASSLSEICQCRNVTRMNIKVSSLAACFIVTKENEPLLRRLYAVRSSAFPLVSCACGPCSELSQHVLEAAQRAINCCFWVCSHCCSSVALASSPWHHKREVRVMPVLSVLPGPPAPQAVTFS